MITLIREEHSRPIYTYSNGSKSCFHDVITINATVLLKRNNESFWVASEIIKDRLVISCSTKKIITFEPIHIYYNVKEEWINDYIEKNSALTNEEISNIFKNELKSYAAICGTRRKNKDYVSYHIEFTEKTTKQIIKDISLMIGV